MDCSEFADSLTLEAHATLQYMASKARFNNKGDYRKGVMPLLRYMSASQAGTAIGLLRDVEAISPMDNDEVVYRVNATCGCQESLLKKIPLALSDQLDSLEAMTRIGPNDCQVIRSSPTDGGRSVSTPTEKDWNPERARDRGWMNKEAWAWNATDLARYFDTTLVSVLKSEQRPTAGQSNEEALRGNIKKWRDQGWDSPTIKAMIDAFCVSPGRWCKNGTPAWRAFISAASRLHHRVEKAGVVEAPVEETPIIGMANRRLAARRAAANQ